jgi:DNA-directed RNA polymerase subunit omega
MARVTVEDCVGEGKTNNRFELVILSAQRAKDIHSGSPVTVPIENDKKTVLALKEIAAGNIKMDELRLRFLNSLHPLSVAHSLSEDFESVDRDLIEDEFSIQDSDYALTEDQMVIDEEDSLFFDDVDLSEDDKK